MCALRTCPICGHAAKIVKCQDDQSPSCQEYSCHVQCGSYDTVKKIICEHCGIEMRNPFKDRVKWNYEKAWNSRVYDDESYELADIKNEIVYIAEFIGIDVHDEKRIKSFSDVLLNIYMRLTDLVRCELKEKIEAGR